MQVGGIRKLGRSQVFPALANGRGRIEGAFFAEADFEFAQLLTRDCILIVEGGLREDEFSGGFSLRARRGWDFHQVCPQSAKRLNLRLDLRVAGVLDRIEALLAQHRPGATPLRYDLLLPDGAAGTLDRSEEHTSELQSLMRISYAVFCLKKKKQTPKKHAKHNVTQ